MLNARHLRGDSLEAVLPSPNAGRARQGDQSPSRLTMTFNNYFTQSLHHAILE